VSRVHGVQPTYRFAARAFFPRLLAAESLPNVTDQKTYSLKENGLEKGWYVIFVQIILARKNARKKPKSQMNFVKPTKLKKNRFLEFGLKKPIWKPWSREQYYWEDSQCAPDGISSC
jgi:hypothetical protein